MKKIIMMCAMAGVVAGVGSVTAAQKKIKKEKLQIVFLMGQSNMVGLSDMRTAWYLTQPQYVAPKELVTTKSPSFDWEDLHWQGLRTFKGPQKYKDALDQLYLERRASRAKWRQRVNGVHGPWKEEWGEKPVGGGRGVMYPYLDKKAEEEGIYKRMDEIISSSDNAFPVDVAYAEISARQEANAAAVARVRDIYLNGTTAEEFDAFAAAVEEAKIPARPTEDVEAVRAKYAALAQQYVNLPIAKRTHIYAFGHVTGSEGEQNKYMTHGPLSVGFGGGVTTIGPEYGVGITLERLVDAPILLVKCSWGNTALRGSWRPPTLDGVETPVETATREAWNKTEIETAKRDGREPKLRAAPEKTGELTYCWGMTIPQIEKVLADPGKYHPEYDPKVGYEVAGMVWFQGYSDAGNKAYGEQLVELVKFMRNKVKAPKMPFVAGTLGMASYKHIAFKGEVNTGMVQASQDPEMKGTFDVVNTAPFFPKELDLANRVRKLSEKGSPEYEKAAAVLRRAASNKGFHYHGSAKCFLLMGDAMGRSLANLMAGGEPAIASDPPTSADGLPQ